MKKCLVSILILFVLSTACTKPPAEKTVIERLKETRSKTLDSFQGIPWGENFENTRSLLERGRYEYTGKSGSYQTFSGKTFGFDTSLFCRFSDDKLYEVTVETLPNSIGSISREKFFDQLTQMYGEPPLGGGSFVGASWFFSNGKIDFQPLSVIRIIYSSDTFDPKKQK